MEDYNKAFMMEAIRLGIEGMNNDEGGPFGAVIVKDNEIKELKNNNKGLEDEIAWTKKMIFKVDNL